MIATLAELFVERVDTRGAPALTAARRLLVVDATSRPERVTEMLGELERLTPVSCCLVELDDLPALPDVAKFELVWLLAGVEIDAGYGGLLAEELDARCPGARVDALRAEIDLAPGALDGGLPWRRRAAVRASAQRLAERLAS